MGLGNETFTRSSNSISVVGGKWTKRVEAGTIGAVERKLTKGKHEGESVFEVGYPTISGRLVSGKLVESEMVGMTAEIILNDGNEEFSLSFSASVKEMSQHLKNLVRALPNVDTSKEVALNIRQHPTKKTRTGNPVCYLGVYQDKKQVSDFYCEWKTGADGRKYPEMLNGMPEAEKLRDGSYDFRDQNDFLLQKFEDYFADFQGEAPVAAAAEPDQHPADGDEDGDPCPF